MQNEVTTDNYFGGCPQCGEGSYVNVHKDHYNICDKHKVYWYIGSNLFSSWQEENEEIWNSNATLLEGFQEVKPIYPKNLSGESRQTLAEELEQLTDNLMAYKEVIARDVGKESPLIGLIHRAIEVRDKSVMESTICLCGRKIIEYTQAECEGFSS